MFFPWSNIVCIADDATSVNTMVAQAEGAAGGIGVGAGGALGAGVAGAGAEGAGITGAAVAAGVVAAAAVVGIAAGAVDGEDGVTPAHH